MKTKNLFSLVSLACIFFCALLVVPAIYAQTVLPVQPDAHASFVVPTEAQNFVIQFLTGLIAKHAWLATLITVIGSMRLWAKPVFSALHAFALLTPSTWDDGLWEKVNNFFTNTAVGKFLAYLLDWFTSIKVVPPSTPKAVEEKKGGE